LKGGQLVHGTGACWIPETGRHQSKGKVGRLYFWEYRKEARVACNIAWETSNGNSGCPSWLTFAPEPSATLEKRGRREKVFRGRRKKRGGRLRGGEKEDSDKSPFFATQKEQKEKKKKETKKKTKQNRQGKSSLEKVKNL